MSSSPTIITSSGITTQRVDTDVTSTDSLEIGSAKITSVSTDMNDSSSETLATSYAVAQLNRRFDRDVAAFQEKLNDNRITPIISEAVTPPYFGSDSQWTTQKFIYQYGQAIYRNDLDAVGLSQAAVYLSNDAFLWDGSYFITLMINHLPSGASIDLKNESNTVLATFNTSGKHMTTLTVADKNSCSISLHANNIPVNEFTIIDRVYLYFVQDRAIDYFKFTGGDIISNGAGLATTTYVDTVLTTATNNLKSYADSTAMAVNERLATHIDQKNGHNAIPSDIGAATAGHSHIPSTIGAAAAVHTHSPDECGAASTSHTHRPSDIGAATFSHTHTPDECGAASSTHNHDIGSLNGAGPVVTHASAIGNVHGMVKNNIALGNVENYAIATEADYLNNSATTYATPDGMMDHLNTIFSVDPTMKYIPLAPKQLSNTSFSLAANAEYTLNLKANAVYEIFINCKSNTNANYLGMYFSNVAYDAAGTNYMTSFEYGRTLDNVNSTGWWSENADMFYMMPKELANNIVKGKIVIDTNLMTITGTFQSWVGTVSGGTVSLTTSTIYPLKFSGSCKEALVLTAPYKFTFRHNANRRSEVSVGTINASIIVYEMVTVGNEASLYDRMPLLSRTEYVGTKPPLGWALENGAELVKADYGELASFLQTYGTYLTLTDYAAQITATSKCVKFGMSDTVIKMPTNPYTPTDGVLRIVKIKR